MATGDLDRVRALHRPVWHDPLGARTAQNQVWLVCRGCDAGSYAEDPPGWPCSTADIVYTAEEIAAREIPAVPECPNHPRAQLVALRAGKGTGLLAARWGCDVTAEPFSSPDPRGWDS